MRIGRTWNGMYGIFNEQDVLISITYNTEEKAKDAMERMKSNKTNGFY